MVVQNVALKIIVGMFELPSPVYAMFGLWILVRLTSDRMIKGALAMRPLDAFGNTRKAENVTLDEGMEQLSKMALDGFKSLLANLEELSYNLNMLSDYLLEISLTEVAAHLKMIKEDVKCDEFIPETLAQEVLEEIEEMQMIVEEAKKVERKINLADWRSVSKPNGIKVLVRQRSITPGLEEVIVKANGCIRTKWGRYTTTQPIKIGTKLIVKPTGTVIQGDYKYYPQVYAGEYVFWHEDEELDLKKPIREKLRGLIRKIQRKRDQMQPRMETDFEPDRQNRKDSVTHDYDVHDQHEVDQLLRNYV